jgi:histidinol-phosphatase (PHP family)
MSWSRSDLHSHICRHSPDAMLAAARAAGLIEYGITEHVFMLHEGQPLLPHQEEDGERCDRDWYVATIREHAAATGDLALRLGLEVDYFPAQHTAILDVLAGVEWDYLIGSVHEYDGIDIFSDAPADEDEGRRRWVRYYEVMAEAIESGVFDVISHPVRNAERNLYVPDNLDQLLSEIAAFAQLHGVALELNGYDTLNWPQLVERLAAACGRAGCYVTLGSDAHQPSHVAAGLERAEALARAAGVPGRVSFQRRERRLVPFE